MAIDVANFLSKVFENFSRIVTNFCPLKEGDSLDICSENKIMAFETKVSVTL